MVCHALAMVKIVQISRPITFEPTGAVAQLLERSVCVREAEGSIPGRVIPKTFKMVLAALLLRSALRKRNWRMLQLMLWIFGR